MDVEDIPLLAVSDKIKNNRRIIKMALRHSKGRFNPIVQNLPESLQQNIPFLLELP